MVAVPCLTVQLPMLYSVCLAVSFRIPRRALCPTDVVSLRQSSTNPLRRDGDKSGPPCKPVQVARHPTNMRALSHVTKTEPCGCLSPPRTLAGPRGRVESTAVHQRGLRGHPSITFWSVPALYTVNTIRMDLLEHRETCVLRPWAVRPQPNHLPWGMLRCSRNFGGEWLQRRVLQTTRAWVWALPGRSSEIRPPQELLMEQTQPGTQCT